MAATKPTYTRQPLPAMRPMTNTANVPQGPAQGGPEVPGTPNTSPSTAAVDGLYKAVQQIAPNPTGWAEVPGPESTLPMLGERVPPSDPSVKVLGRLVRGVY